MNRSRFVCVFRACIMLITAIAAVVLMAKNIVTAGLIMAALAILVSVTIIMDHLHFTQQHNLHIRANEQMLLFIPLSNDQSNKLDPTNDIVEIDYDSIKSGINVNEEKKVVLNITQKYRLFFTKVVNVQVDPNHECILLSNHKQISYNQKSGIFVHIKAEPSVIKDILSKIHLHIKYFKMKNGVLSLTFNYSALCNHIKYAFDLLTHKTGKDSVTLYELLLRDMLKSCPNDSSLLIPSSISAGIKSEDLWINQVRGRLTLTLLMVFRVSMILGNGSVFDEDEELSSKIKLLQNYIVSNKLTPKPQDIFTLSEKIKRKFYAIHGVANYSSLYLDYYTIRGMPFSKLISSEICGGHTILAIMIAIASYQCKSSKYHVKTNNFFRRILHSAGSGDLIAEVNNVINGDLSEKINLHSCKVLTSKISIGLMLISKSLGSISTIREVVNSARDYVMLKYFHNVAILKSVPDFVEFESTRTIAFHERSKQTSKVNIVNCSSGSSASRYLMV